MPAFSSLSRGLFGTIEFSKAFFSFSYRVPGNNTCLQAHYCDQIVSCWEQLVPLNPKPASSTTQMPRIVCLGILAVDKRQKLKVPAKYFQFAPKDSGMFGRPVSATASSQHHVPHILQTLALSS